MKYLCREERANRGWTLLGWGGVIAGVLILSYYSVIAGWSLSYVMQSASSDFVGITNQGVGELFASLISNPGKLIFLAHIVYDNDYVCRGARGQQWAGGGGKVFNAGAGNINFSLDRVFNIAWQFLVGCGIFIHA